MKYLVTVRALSDADYRLWNDESESVDPGMDSTRFPHLAEYAFEVEEDLFEGGELALLEIRAGQNRPVVSFGIQPNAMW